MHDHYQLHYKKSLIFHDRNKHTDTRYFSSRKRIIKKEVQLKFVKPQGQIVDIFTTIPLFQNIGIRVQIVDIFNYNNPITPTNCYQSFHIANNFCIRKLKVCRQSQVLQTEMKENWKWKIKSMWKGEIP